MIKGSLKVTSDFTKQFQAVVSRFRNDEVLVGIPQEDGQRDGDAPINNAALLAINHFGSPKQNIPARPALSIGIRKAKEPIAEEFKKAAQNALKVGLSAITTYYERAGIIASNAVKKVITDQEGIAPPAESTLKARKYLTGSGFKGTKALLVTGQMRNAITYVLKGKG